MANINIAGMDHAKIQEIITYTEYYPNLSRRTLANTICENLEWKTPAGSLKVNSCLSLLDKLEKQGEVKLKPLEKRVHKPNGDLKILKQRYLSHIAMFSTISVTIYLSAAGLQKFVAFDYAKGVQMPFGESVTSFQYFMTQLHVIPYYIKLLFIPTNLNLDYDWPIIMHLDLTTVLFFILLAAIAGFGIWAYRRAKLLSFAVIWFFVTLSVTSSFLVIYDMIFEHRLYLPSIGFAIFAALLISKISSLKKSNRSDNLQPSTFNLSTL